MAGDSAARPVCAAPVAEVFVGSRIACVSLCFPAPTHAAPSGSPAVGPLRYASPRAGTAGQALRRHRSAEQPLPSRHPPGKFAGHAASRT